MKKKKIPFRQETNQRKGEFAKGHLAPAQNQSMENVSRPWGLPPTSRSRSRRTLYHAWIGGLVMCNAQVYLPRLTQGNLQELQTAMNAGVRACSGLPRRGRHPVSDARVRLDLPSVWQLKEEQILMRAWKNRATHLNVVELGPSTRSTAKNKRTLVHGGKDPIELEEIKGWNRLPIELKLANNEKRVKGQIRKLVRSHERVHE